MSTIDYKDEHFLRLPLSALMALVESEELDCEEDRLFKACVVWAENQLKPNEEKDADDSDDESKTNIKIDPSAVRLVLDPLIAHFRFLSLDIKSLISLLNYHPGVLTLEENSCLIAYKMAPKISKVPDGFSSNKNSRNKVTHDEIMVYGCLENDPIITGDIFETTYKIFSGDTWILEDPDNDHLIVDVPTQIKPSIDDDDQYKENFTIVVHIDDSEYIPIQETFTPNVKYGTIIKIPIRIPADADEDTWNVVVVYHLIGKYPISGVECDSKKLEM
jgi:hypothetical protein